MKMIITLNFKDCTGTLIANKNITLYEVLRYSMDNFGAKPDTIKVEISER